MFDPTQTQPLSWRMQDGQPKPWGEVPVERGEASMEPTSRQAPSFDDSPPDRLSEGGYRLRGRVGSGRLGAIYEAQDELSRISGSKHFVAIQLLDGVAAGIFGVISVLIASDLMRGTGRFNLAQGLVALSVGVGAGLSNTVAGYVVQWFGYATGFLYLAGIAGCALLFFAILMPETKASGSDAAGPGATPEAALRPGTAAGGPAVA